MHCETQLDEGLFYIGGSDRRIHLFENVYPLTNGVSYNSYLYLDEKTVLLDTVDKAVSGVFYDNLEFLLQGRKLDYLIVNHMEPDHAANIGELLLRYPDVTVVVNAMSERFLHNFFPHLKCKIQLVKEGDKLCSGKRTFTFVMAPMVHWPEVMFSYDMTSGTLFSADAFGSYGAIDGGVFADEHDFENDLKGEARRYYTNIVGKYGMQTQSALEKASSLDIEMICPLHSYVWRKNFADIIGCYDKWSTYTPEKSAVLIVEGSIYGNTANACEVLASELSALGVDSVIYDASVRTESEFIAAAFRYSHIVVASPTYNMEIYSPVEHVVDELIRHGLRNRTVAVIENGSWAPQSGKLLREKLASFNVLEDKVCIKSSLNQASYTDLCNLAKAIKASM